MNELEVIRSVVEAEKGKEYAQKVFDRKPRVGRGIGESEEGARKVTKMRKGLTLMELLTVMSILATLAALLFPVYLKVRSRVYQTSCANQLRQIGIAIHMYANDYGECMPTIMEMGRLILCLGG